MLNRNVFAGVLANTATGLLPYKTQIGYFYARMVLSRRNAVFLCILIALLAFAEASVPYVLAWKNAPHGYQFSGQVMYGPDQNMYFSFISQARDGAFLLADKLIWIANKPVFVNLEYWLVGFIQRITGMPENAVYQVWRLLGALLLAVGFFKVAALVLPSWQRRIAAFALFFLAGGFGFVFGILGARHLISFNTMQSGIIDARYGMLPLQQIISNPHFSLPHGLILLAYALFLAGERWGKLKHYVYSGLMFTIIGFVRPYDLIPPFLIFPLYALFADGRLHLDRNMIVRRMLPLLMILPVFAYNVWLFKYHEIFRYWSLQGHNAEELPGPLWHYMAYGAVGLLAIVRLVQARKYPPGKTGTFVFLWFAVTFVFIQVGRFIPAIGWSPQIGVYLAAPLTLAACSLQFNSQGERQLRKMLLPTVILLVLAGNLFLVVYHARKFTGKVQTDTFYTSNAEMKAFDWMKTHTKPATVVMADNASSLRIGKYTSNAVVTAHYSVSPKFIDYYYFCLSMMADKERMAGSEPIPYEITVDYVYLKKGIDSIPALKGNYLSLVYENEGVVIYHNNEVRRTP